MVIQYILIFAVTPHFAFDKWGHHLINVLDKFQSPLSFSTRVWPRYSVSQGVFPCGVHSCARCYQLDSWEMMRGYIMITCLHIMTKHRFHVHNMTNLKLRITNSIHKFKDAFNKSYNSEIQNKYTRNSSDVLSNLMKNELSLFTRYFIMFSHHARPNVYCLSSNSNSAIILVSYVVSWCAKLLIVQNQALVVFLSSRQSL